MNFRRKGISYGVSGHVEVVSYVGIMIHFF